MSDRHCPIDGCEYHCETEGQLVAHSNSTDDHPNWDEVKRHLDRDDATDENQGESDGNGAEMDESDTGGDEEVTDPDEALEVQREQIGNDGDDGADESDDDGFHVPTTGIVLVGAILIIGVVLLRSRPSGPDRGTAETGETETSQTDESDADRGLV